MLTIKVRRNRLPIKVLRHGFYLTQDRERVMRSRLTWRPVEVGDPIPTDETGRAIPGPWYALTPLGVLNGLFRIQLRVED
jgi:hypothetical protein